MGCDEIHKFKITAMVEYLKAFQVMMRSTVQLAYLCEFWPESVAGGHSGMADTYWHSVQFLKEKVSQLIHSKQCIKQPHLSVRYVLTTHCQKPFSRLKDNSTYVRTCICTWYMFG